MKKKYLIIGAGFSGAVLAEQLSHKGNVSILVLDERDHVGGNCYTETDEMTGIIEHKYGPHIFNTDDQYLWNYISGFCKMIPFINRVKAIYKGEVFSFPVNLHTINQFFRKSFDPKSAKSYIESLSEKSIREPRNFEELALKTMGKDLYMAFFYHYTKKQWGCEPSDLPASILQRLPVRFDYNDNYYDKRFQGIPEEGYTPIFEKMLAQPAIKVQLNTKFNNEFIVDEFDHVFYSGRIDAFFNYEYGRLCYRTVFFEKGIEDGDFQGNAVINYTDDSVPFTRIHEHKHFTPWMNYQKTIFFKEFSKETCEKDIPFYPKRLSADLEKLNLYQDKVKKLKKFTFFGRLGSYCYMDMQHVINDAIKIANKF